jgi:hypothetical protein
MFDIRGSGATRNDSARSALVSRAPASGADHGSVSASARRPWSTIVARSRRTPLAEYGCHAWSPATGSSTIETCAAPTVSPERKRPSRARTEDRKPSASEAWPNASCARPFASA